MGPKKAGPPQGDKFRKLRSLAPHLAQLHK
jgi:hypothetical protein